MTGDAQPPSADEAAWQDPGARRGDDRPRYHEPSYDRPGPSAGSPDAAERVEPMRTDDSAGAAPWPAPPWGRGPQAMSLRPSDYTGAPSPYAGPASPPSPAPPPYAGPASPPPPAAVPAPPYPVSGGLPLDGPALAGGASPVRPLATVPPPPSEAWRPPRRVEAVPGTSFGVVHLDVPPVTSGLAVGALVAGIASIVVSLLVACFGVAGARGGWGAWAAGAFAVLAALLGLAGIVLGGLGRRQVNRVAPAAALRFSGRGLAVAGLSCGGVGLGLTVLGLAAALLLQVG